VGAVAVEEAEGGVAVAGVIAEKEAEAETAVVQEIELGRIEEETKSEREATIGKWRSLLALRPNCLFLYEETTLLFVLQLVVVAHGVRVSTL